MYCSNCGNKVSEKAVVCVKCGAPVNNKNITSNSEKGKSIASMVLGIIALLFTISMLDIDLPYYMYSVGSALVAIIIPATLATISLSLSVVARKQKKDGFNTAGFWLSISSFILITILFLAMLVY